MEAVSGFWPSQRYRCLSVVFLAVAMQRGQALNWDARKAQGAPVRAKGRILILLEGGGRAEDSSKGVSQRPRGDAGRACLACVRTVSELSSANRDYRAEPPWHEVQDARIPSDSITSSPI